MCIVSGGHAERANPTRCTLSETRCGPRSSEATKRTIISLGRVFFYFFCRSFVAMKVASIAPDRVNKLILADPVEQVTTDTENSSSVEVSCCARQLLSHIYPSSASQLPVTLSSPGLLGQEMVDIYSEP